MCIMNEEFIIHNRNVDELRERERNEYHKTRFSRFLQREEDRYYSNLATPKF